MAKAARSYLSGVFLTGEHQALPSLDFDRFILEQPQIKGLADFAGQIPSLLAQRVTHCGTAEVKGFAYSTDGRGAMKDEFNEYIFYNRFGLYLKAGTGNEVIRARIELPYWFTPSVISHCSERFGSLLRGAIASDEESALRDARFRNASLEGIQGERSFLVRASLFDMAFAAGPIAPLWYSYYQKVLKPFLKLVNENRAT